MNKKVIYIVIIVFVLSVGNVVYAAVNKDGVKKVKVSLMNKMEIGQTVNKDKIILPLVSGLRSEELKRNKNYSNTDSYSFNTNGEPYFTANKDIVNYNNLNVYDLVNFDSIETNNGKLKLAKVMTYEAYQKKHSPESMSYNISPNRMVYVVQIYYPKGFHHAKVGFIDNCLTTVMYDIESSLVLESSFKRLD